MGKLEFLIGLVLGVGLLVHNKRCDNSHNRPVLKLWELIRTYSLHSVLILNPQRFLFSYRHLKASFHPGGESPVFWGLMWTSTRRLASSIIKQYQKSLILGPPPLSRARGYPRRHRLLVSPLPSPLPALLRVGSATLLSSTMAEHGVGNGAVVH